MSLLNTIFGKNAEKKSEQVSVFETKVSVPEPKPLPPSKIPKEKPPLTPTATGDGSTKKRKRKEPKAEFTLKEPLEGPTVEKPSEESKQAEERTVFVGNLPTQYNRKSLAKLFKDCGKVESSRIRSLAVTGVKLPQENAGNQKMVKKVCANTSQVDTKAKSSVQGYVVFVNKDAIEKALVLNNTEVKDERTGTTRRIRVDHANAEYDAARSIFVGNLPYTADEDSLAEHFCEGCGLNVDDIQGVRIVRDKETFQCKGFGYVLFSDQSMVTLALQRMSGSLYAKRELRVMVCGRRFKGKKGDAMPKENKKRSFEGRRASAPVSPAASVGALRRIIKKQVSEAPTKKRRARGEKTSEKPTARKAGVSRRAAVEAKVEKRVKKLQKRAAKGMGKKKM
jgi:nucleolar protein 12